MNNRKAAEPVNANRIIGHEPDDGQVSAFLTYRAMIPDTQIGQSICERFGGNAVQQTENKKGS